MYEQVEKPKENKSRGVTKKTIQKRSNSKKGYSIIIQRNQQQSSSYCNEVIQRRGVNVGASSVELTAQYNALMASQTFADLDKLVTTNTNITLVDSSVDPHNMEIDYDSGNHTIRVPLNDSLNGATPRPLADIKEDIMWEMHNASIRGSLNRSTAKYRDLNLPANATLDEKRRLPYKNAGVALSVEWDEWINVVEHDLRTQCINADPAMGAGGPHVTRTFAACYPDPHDGNGWFKFKIYLQNQIDLRHTEHYDPAANREDWKGKKIIHRLQDTHPSLNITQKERDDFISGKTKKVKRPENNPFTTVLINEM